jgi:uncharacterized protein
MPSIELSRAEARRLAIHAQGLGGPRPVRPARGADLLATVRRLGLLQIDYVTILVPAQYQVLYARHGPFDRALLDRLLFRRRALLEQWAHEASIVPAEAWPLLAHRRETHRARPWSFQAFLSARPDYVARVLDLVRERGPVGAEDLDDPDGHPARLEHSWFGSVRRATLEALFGQGALAIAGRRPDFSRLYDLAGRVVPPAHAGRVVDREAAQRALLAVAARAHGVATGGDLADYWRMPAREAGPRILELAETGEIAPARVEGLREPAWVHRSARVPARVEGAALLSPFDPLVWTRRRTARLFGFEYRLEIFVPEEKRRFGAYVLPILLGDRLAGRLDLKSDRACGRLLVRSAHLEPGEDPGALAEAAASELVALAAWLGLGAVKVERRGGLARALADAVRVASGGRRRYVPIRTCKRSTGTRSA